MLGIKLVGYLVALVALVPFALVWILGDLATALGRWTANREIECFGLEGAFRFDAYMSALTLVAFLVAVGLTLGAL